MIPHSKSTLSSEDRSMLLKTYSSGSITSGPVNAQFSGKLGSYLGQEYISLFSSGSSALFHILKALELKPGDRIMIPDYICESVLKAVTASGCKPVLYDNAAGQWNSTPEKISEKLDASVKAIVINHTFGILFPEVNKLGELGVPVIEDCAHALTPAINRTKISQYSIASFYSFNATKLIATGEGGAVATSDSRFHKAITDRRVDKGLSDLSSALGISQLKKLPSFLKKRKEIATYYDKELEGFQAKKNQSSICFRYPVMVNNPDAFLKNKKVAFRKGVDKLLHYELGLSDAEFPNVTEVFHKTISLPLYPSLTRKEMKTVVEETKKHLSRK